VAKSGDCKTLEWGKNAAIQPTGNSAKLSVLPQERRTILYNASECYRNYSLSQTYNLHITRNTKHTILRVRRMKKKKIKEYRIKD
jgi:hypothetical protein